MRRIKSWLLISFSFSGGGGSSSRAHIEPHRFEKRRIDRSWPTCVTSLQLGCQTALRSCHFVTGEEMPAEMY